MDVDTLFWMFATGIVAFGLGRMKGASERPGDGRPASPPGDLSDEARRRMEHALAQGAMIEAIKIVREDTNCGLKEAKAFVTSFGERRRVRRKGDPIQR